MPQRKRFMDNESLQFSLATTSGLWAWMTAEKLAIIVPVLWGVYVLLLIAKTLPDVFEKHPWIKQFTCGTADLFRRAWRRMFR